MKKQVSKVHNLLLAKRKTIAIAESCTGGLLSQLLTNNPGSSEYFLFGAITYSNSAKEKILGIPPKLIRQKGAVSQEVAIKMSQSIRKIIKADIGIGITGIAGPAGGSKAKPVGTVFISISDKKETFCKKYIFKGTRIKIREKSALKALELLYARLHCH